MSVELAGDCNNVGSHRAKAKFVLQNILQSSNYVLITTTTTTIAIVSGHPDQVWVSASTMPRIRQLRQDGRFERTCVVLNQVGPGFSLLLEVVLMKKLLFSPRTNHSINCRKFRKWTWSLQLRENIQGTRMNHRR